MCGPFASVSRCRTLQNWEQRHRNPTGPAIALLKIVERAPEVAVKVLQSA